MSAQRETSTRCTARNEPVDVALEIALEAADDTRVRELIREAQQFRECALEEATDAEVRNAIAGGDD